jgi:uncharacterized protein with NRDE domain
VCLAVLALAAHPDYPLVIAANRDEFHARAAAPAEWGRAPPFVDILAGRDLEAGGTWFGVRRDGRWALVTNVRGAGIHDPAARSRGELVTRALAADALSGDALAPIIADGDRYNAYNLLAGDATAAVWTSNRASGVRHLHDGLHGVSNASLDTRWPKLERTLARVQAWAGSGNADAAPLFDALSDREAAPDALLPATGVTLEQERLLSPPFIVSERYGTRCSTVFTIDRAGRAHFHERSFAPDGAPTGETIEDFTLA